MHATKDWERTIPRRLQLSICCAAAALIVLCAGCGWSSGPSFKGEYDPENLADPVTQVQNWFKSMEWKVTGTDEDGNPIRDPEEGRDFDLFLTVVDPAYLMDQSGQYIGQEQLDELQEKWNSRDWEIEFRDIVLEEVSRDDENATVKITDGKVRYIGREFFGTSEWKDDGFGDKEGEIYLEWYEDELNDPLKNLPQFDSIAGKGRWVIVGGLDLSEEERFPRELQENGVP